MGGLIPNGNDLEVLNKLNARFGPIGLLWLRQWMAQNNDDTFAASRQLHRISYRLGIYPTSGPRPKARWFVFLKTLIGATNSHTIQSAIRDAVNDWSTTTTPPMGCFGIQFWAVYDPTLSQDYEVDVYKAAADGNGQYWLSITLICKHEISQDENGIQDPTTPDNGERGSPPPVTTARRRATRVAMKSPSAKKARRRMVKKSSRKASKRAARKAGKKTAKKSRRSPAKAMVGQVEE